MLAIVSPYPGQSRRHRNQYKELSKQIQVDGAASGEFNVTALWPEAIPAGADEEMYQPKDRLKDKYISAEQSGLKITVPEGGGELPPIEVKS